MSAFGGGCHQKIGISVIPHRLGSVLSLQGLTPEGQTLREWRFRSRAGAVPPQMSAEQMWILGSQQKLASVTLPEAELQSALVKIAQAPGLFVAKNSAWPTDFTAKPEQIVWTAGLQTWRNLARLGVWVHGSQESLGELHPFQLEAMVPNLQHWLKLTHREAGEALAPLPESAKNIRLQPLPTYQLTAAPADLQILPQHRFFFWSSSTVFAQALRQHPEIVRHFHATGLGHTYDLVCHHVRDKTQVFAFANENDWRQQCKL